MHSRYGNGNVPMYQDPFASPEAVEALRAKTSPEAKGQEAASDVDARSSAVAEETAEE